MGEAEWLAATDPGAMLAFLRGKASDRKLRLLGCTCARFVWGLAGEEAPLAVELAEAYADGSASKASLYRARKAVQDERHRLEAAGADARLRWRALWLAEVVATLNAHAGVIPELQRLSPDVVVVQEAEWAEMRGRVRDIFANPFRPVTVDPSWLTSTVVGLAESVYQQRSFHDLPILADALEEAGCDRGDMLGHCRGAGGHVRGCWVVDLLTGRG